MNNLKEALGFTAKHDVFQKAEKMYFALLEILGVK